MTVAFITYEATNFFTVENVCKQIGADHILFRPAVLVTHLTDCSIITCNIDSQKEAIDLTERNIFKDEIMQTMLSR